MSSMAVYLIVFGHHHTGLSLVFSLESDSTTTNVCSFVRLLPKPPTSLKSFISPYHNIHHHSHHHTQHLTHHHTQHHNTTSHITSHHHATSHTLSHVTTII